MERKLLVGILAVLILVSVTVVFTYNFSTSAVKASALDDSKATKKGVQRVAEGNNKFALDLYKRLLREDGNVFFSPWSISTALSMTYEGARGETAEEMQSVLHVPENDTIRRSSFARLYNLMNVNKKYELSLANALWTQKGYPFLENYLDINKKYYGAKVESLDFGNPSKAAEKINGWVKEKTRDKIKELVNENILSGARLVLTNAIYFKGDWVKKFDEDLTREEDFKVSPEKTVQVPMMRHEEEKEFNCTERGNLKALKLPYKGGDLSMLILLPKKDFGLSKLEENLTSERLGEIEKDLHTEDVRVYLPKFELETKYRLKETLEEMGMVRAFGGADFSGMTGSKDLFIDSVVHKAYVKVNEKGTEAAAATGVVMKESAVRHKTFRADHPFMFMIKDDRTGAILFLGKVVNPKG